ncbi:MAG: hypothetical protein D6759_18025 [Chloroflexi bacterium]|nr:MAG: hypothetical protein D6759_18025 [Chloroflexota bacterium]
MEQTPLFQLNLMLWLVWPALPPSVNIHPVFREDGFTLRGIGWAFALPLEVRVKAEEAGLPVKARASPDLLLDHRQRKLLLPIECKVSSFGPNASGGSRTHPALQATALLATDGPSLADYLGLIEAAQWRAYLLYAVGGGAEDAMQGTLTELGYRLQAAHIEPVPAGALGIHLRDDGIYLQPAPGAEIPVAALRSPPPNGVRVVEREDGDDPRPLYLLPWDPSIGLADEYERRILEERVRSALASLIGRRLDAPAFEVTLDEVLQEAVDVWEVWRDRQAVAGFRRAVRRYVRQVLKPLHKMGLNVQVHQDTLVFDPVTPEMARKVRRYLSSAAFRRGEVDLWSEDAQLGFDSLAEGW